MTTQEQLEKLQSGLKAIKNLKSADVLSGTDKKQQLFLIQEAIDCLNKQYPDYLQNFINTHGEDHKDVQSHINKTINTAISFCENTSLKNI